MSLSDLEELTCFAKFTEKVDSLKDTIELKHRSLLKGQDNEVTVNLPTRSWICGRKHKLVHYKTGLKQITKKQQL